MCVLEVEAIARNVYGPNDTIPYRYLKVFSLDHEDIKLAAGRMALLAPLARWFDEESAVRWMAVLARWVDNESAAGLTVVLGCWRDFESASGLTAVLAHRRDV